MPPPNPGTPPKELLGSFIERSGTKVSHVWTEEEIHNFHETYIIPPTVKAKLSDALLNELTHDHPNFLGQLKWYNRNS